MLTAEVWFAPVPQPDTGARKSNLSRRWKAAVLACLCLVAAIITAGLMKPDIDDAYYVNVATSVNEFPDRLPLSFDAMHRDGLPPVEEALHLPQSYEVLVGLVSSVSGISVPTLYYIFFPPFWAVLGTLAHWLVLRHLLPRREALLATAIWIFLIAFWGDGIRAFGSFGFARIFQGKSVFLVVLAPLIVLAGLRYRQRPGLPTWICLALSESAASALTTNGIIIAPLLAALAIAARPRFDRAYLRALAGGALASVPVIVVAALMHARLCALSHAGGSGPVLQAIPDHPGLEARATDSSGAAVAAGPRRARTAGERRMDPELRVDRCHLDLRADRIEPRDAGARQRIQLAHLLERSCSAARQSRRGHCRGPTPRSTLAA